MNVIDSLTLHIYALSEAQLKSRLKKIQMNRINCIICHWYMQKKRGYSESRRTN